MRVFAKKSLKIYLVLGVTKLRIISQHYFFQKITKLVYFYFASYFFVNALKLYLLGAMHAVFHVLLKYIYFGWHYVCCLRALLEVKYKIRTWLKRLPKLSFQRKIMQGFADRCRCCAPISGCLPWGWRAYFERSLRTWLTTVTDVEDLLQ